MSALSRSIPAELITAAVKLTKSDDQLRGCQFDTAYYYSDRGWVVRYKAHKAFRPFYLNDHGRWVSSEKGVKGILYNLHNVQVAIRNGWLVFIVEGEKDADTLNAHFQAHGIHAVATTANGGSNRWLPAHSSPLAGASVVIIPDNDKVGHDGAIKKARALRAAGVGSLKMIELPSELNSEPVKDASDYLSERAGGKVADLLSMVATASEYYPPVAPTVRFERTVAPRLFDADDKTLQRARDYFYLHVETMARATDGRRWGDGSTNPNNVALIGGTLERWGLPRSEVYSAVRGAAESNGSFAKYGQGWFESEFNSGYKKGLTEPRNLPDTIRYGNDSRYALPTVRSEQTVSLTAILITNVCDTTCHTDIPNGLESVKFTDLPSLADELATIKGKAQAIGKEHPERINFDYVPASLPSSLAALPRRYMPEPILKIIDVMINERRPLTHRELIELTELSPSTYWRYSTLIFVSNRIYLNTTYKSESRETAYELGSYEGLLEVLRQTVITPRVYKHVAQRKRVALPEANDVLIAGMSGLPRDADHAAIAATVNATLDPLLTDAERRAHAKLWGDVLAEVDTIMEGLQDWRGATLIARADRTVAAACALKDTEHRVSLRKLAEQTGIDRRTAKDDLTERGYSLVPAYAHYPITDHRQLPNAKNKRRYKGKPQRIVIYTLEDEHADPDDWRWIEAGHIPRRDWSEASVKAALGDGNTRLELECRTESILKRTDELTDDDQALISRESNAASVGARNRVSTQRESKPKYADVVKANYLDRAPALAAVLGDKMQQKATPLPSHVETAETAEIEVTPMHTEHDLEVIEIEPVTQVVTLTSAPMLPLADIEQLRLANIRRMNTPQVDSGDLLGRSPKYQAQRMKPGYAYAEQPLEVAR